jgi:hypothetical protein
VWNRKHEAGRVVLGPCTTFILLGGIAISGTDSEGVFRNAYSGVHGRDSFVISRPRQV